MIYSILHSQANSSDKICRMHNHEPHFLSLTDLLNDSDRLMKLLTVCAIRQTVHEQGVGIRLYTISGHFTATSYNGPHVSGYIVTL